MTFKEYLATRRITDTPTGTFVTDSRGDRRFPDVDSWSDLRAYLSRRAGGGNREAVLEAGYLVWRGYQIKLRKSHADRN
jgi:hypothetical protein